MNPPRLLLLASKLGYQTRSFAQAARKLGIEVIIGSDRCHQLDDPWSDGAIPLHFENPEQAAQALIAAVRDRPVRAILALGDRQTAAAAYAARALGLRYNAPASVENCRNKLRQREVLRAAGLPVPEFFSFTLPGGQSVGAAGRSGGQSVVEASQQFSVQASVQSSVQSAGEPGARSGARSGAPAGFQSSVRAGALDSRGLPAWPHAPDSPHSPDAARILSQVVFPCVLKPLSLSASQGVIRANNEAEFTAAVARIARLLSSPEVQVTREAQLDRVLVERYLPGAEVALEGLLERGHLRVLALFDKPDPLTGPYFEESIYVTPSRLPAEMQRRIVDCAAATAQALGLSEGPVHAEFRVNEAGPWVLEMAPRPIGGLCSQALRFGAERIFLEELLVRQAMGLPGADLPREPLAAGVMMIPVPRSGILEDVQGLDEAARTPGIDQVEITARLHDFIAAWPEGSSYLGFLFARAEMPEQVEAALRAAHGQLSITITPRLPVAHPAVHASQALHGVAESRGPVEPVTGR